MATTCNASTQIYPLAGLSLVVGALAAGLRRLARAVRNRRLASRLAGLDDRMLADIGLTRSDLRDAYAEPLWRDPTDILAGRASERRWNRARGAFRSELPAPPLVPDRRTPFADPFERPRTNDRR